jgi:hypothetical protein
MNFYREPCLAVIIPGIIGLLLFDLHQIPPDGSEMSSLLSGVYFYDRNFSAVIFFSYSSPLLFLGKNPTFFYGQPTLIKNWPSLLSVDGLLMLAVSFIQEKYNYLILLMASSNSLKILFTIFIQ